MFINGLYEKMHAKLQRASSMIKSCKVLSDTLDTTMEICKINKFSPKREGILNNIKADIHMDTPGIRMLCPTDDSCVFWRVLDRLSVWISNVAPRFNPKKY